MNKKTFNFSRKELNELYHHSGLTLKEIGKIFSCSDGTIRKYMVKYNIKLRKPAHLGQTDKARKKIAAAQKGRIHSIEHKWLQGKTNRGKRGEGTTGWKGGRSHDGHGYILIKQHGHPKANKLGYVKEQILVMEKKLGRHLNSKEVVHHINRKRNDNRLENLMLFSSQGKHIEYHNKFDPINR